MTIIVKGLEFYAYHGFTDEEQRIGHRYRVDLEVDLVAGAGNSDDLADTVDYGLICARLVEAGTATQYRLMEHLAVQSAEAMLALDPRIAAVRLTVGKVNPPINQQAEFAGVRVEASR